MQINEIEKVIEFPNSTPQNPVVSVCIITYNHEKYISQCIESVLNQKVQFPIEILISEDESTDQTRDICLQWAEKYPNQIKLFLHSRKNHIKIDGISTGRFPFLWNLQQAKGKYIALLDGDDYWTDPFKLQKQVDFLEAHKEYVVCFHKCFFLQDNQLIEQKDPYINYPYTVYNLLTKWGIPTGALVFRNVLPPQMFPSWYLQVHSGDIALIMMLYEKGKFKLINEALSVYRVDNGISQTHKKNRLVRFRLNLYLHLNQYFNYKYEEEIFRAMQFIISKFSKIPPPVLPSQKPISVNITFKNWLVFNYNWGKNKILSRFHK